MLFYVPLKKNVLILGFPDDDHAAHVAQALLQRDAEAYFLDCRDFPERVEISFDPQEGFGEITFPDGENLRFSDIHSVYWRNYGDANPNISSHLPNHEQQYIAQNDSRSVLDSLVLRLKCKWVNGWEGFQLHQRKPAALSMVAALGVRTPRTLITNSPTSAKEFAARVDKMIFKPVQGGAHTRAITKDELTDERLSRLSLSPVTLQERIDGQNIRVFVAGETVFAIELETSELDFREDNNIQMKAIELSDEMKSTCRKIANTLHLQWTGMDFIRDADGAMHFLEANPSPMFIGFEKYSGLPLTESLCHLLLESHCVDEFHATSSL